MNIVRVALSHYCCKTTLECPKLHNAKRNANDTTLSVAATAPCKW